MKQLLPRVQQLIGYPTGITRWPVMGAWDIPLEGFSTTRCPMPWAATFRNLVLSSHDTTRTSDITQTLCKNNVLTSLTATLPIAENGPVIDDAHSVSFAQYDDCEWEFGANVGTGRTVGWCVEVESQGNIFGIGAHIFGGPVAVNDGGIGGCFGNGFWQTYTPVAFPNPTDLSTTYSICSVAGTVRRIVMVTYATPPGTGASWIARIRKNGVIQDGTGGTVDTTCEMVGNGSRDRAVASVNCHFDVGDIGEVLYTRTGAQHDYEVAGQIAVGIGFIPDHGGHFMMTGGANQALVDPGYVWTMSAQEESDETLAWAPIGPGGLVVRGLAIRGAAPGTDIDDEVTNAVRKNGADTDIAVIRRHLEETGLLANQRVGFAEGDFISLSNIGTGGSDPDASFVYWGLDVAITEADLGIIGPLAWVHWPRRLP